MVDQELRINIYFLKHFQTPISRSILPSYACNRRIRRVLCFSMDEQSSSEFYHQIIHDLAEVDHRFLVF